MKRAFALGAAVFAIALVPAAAQAYPAPSVPITVSDATPAVNDPVTVTITGLESAQSATSTVTSPTSIPDSAIEIAGVAALTKNVPGDSITFTHRFSTNGTYTIKVTTDNGLEIPSQVITVGTSAGSGSGNSADGEGKLPDTGSNGMVGMAALGGGIFLAGATGLYLVRRNNAKVV